MQEEEEEEEEEEDDDVSSAAGSAVFAGMYGISRRAELRPCEWWKQGVVAATVLL